MVFNGGLQKWSKGKQKEKVNNMVLFDQGTYDKLLSEAPKYKLITPSILSDRTRVLFFLYLFSKNLYWLSILCSDFVDSLVSICIDFV